METETEVVNSVIRQRLANNFRQCSAGIVSSYSFDMQMHSTHRTIFQSSLEAPGGGTAVLPN